MRSIYLVIAVLLIAAIPLVSDDSDAEHCTLRLDAIYPTESFEGFGITNFGPRTDLKGFSVTDGEGTVNFTASLFVERYETVYFCKESPPSWFNLDRVVHYGESGVTMKGFALADSGDDICLKWGDQLIDTFVYGDCKSVCDGWKGEPFPKIQKKHIAIRHSLIDTDSSADWNSSVIGRTEFGNGTAFDASVTPFSFPDDYDPLFCAIQDAESRIDISIYLISHSTVISSLLESMKNGVSVRILVEGSPAGGTPSLEIRSLRTLVNNGADVRVMKSVNGYRGYTYLHNKYALIDEDKTIITSENWQESSFESNRGWGAVIQSTEYNSYMERLFLSDFYRCNDVSGFDNLYPTSETVSVDRYQRVDCACQSFKAKVTPVLSPDNSYESLRNFICGAEERVYSEQLNVDYSWVSDNDSPISWMRGISKVTDCRLLVDVTFDDRNDGDCKDGYGVIDSLYTSDIQTGTPSFDGLVHNKGVIVDDSVWIGSTNWTYNSFMENREVAAIIQAKEAADYFVNLFLEDWGGEDFEPEIDVEVENRGDTFLIRANGPIGTIFRWDIDGDGITDDEGPELFRVFSEGHHDVTLQADYGDETYTTVIGVDSVSSSGPIIPMKYYPVIILSAAILIFNLIRWLRPKDDTDKGVQRDRLR